MALKLLRPQSTGTHWIWVIRDVVITEGILAGPCGILWIGFELLPSNSNTYLLFSGVRDSLVQTLELDFLCSNLNTSTF